MRKNLIPAIEEFTELVSSRTMVVKSFSKIKVCKENAIVSIVIAVISFVLSYSIVMQNNTIIIATDIIEFLFTIIMAVFGILLTVYSIVLAFFNEDFMKRLAKIDIDGKSALKDNTEYLESILYLYFISIFTSVIILVFFKSVNGYFKITKDFRLNNLLAIFFIAVYLTYNLRIIYELKSTIYNMAMIFRHGISYKLLDLEKKRQKEEKQADKQTNE